jgi:integrase
MPRCKLTEKTIARLRAPHPSGRQTAYWDAELRGFGVICSGVTAVKSYVCQRDLPGGRTRRVTIAHVSETSLADARERARRLLLDMRSGIDPKHRPAASATLAETLEQYLASMKELSARSRQIYQARVARHLEPWLSRPLGSITPPEVDALHRGIAQRVARASGGQYDGHAVANDAMRVFRLLYNWAARRDDSMPRNPVRLRRSEWHKVTPLRRPIDPEKLRDFYAAVCQLPDMGRDYLLLCLFTGLRRREAASLRWADVDFAQKIVRIPAARTKAGRQLDLPMSDFVHALLVARRALGDAKFVFPSYGRSGHVTDARAWLDAVTERTGIEFSMHDLRRTFVTVAESCGISEYALKALVNHHLDAADVTSGYIKMTPDRLREPAQRVCDRLKELCGVVQPGGRTVTPLRG